MHFYDFVGRAQVLPDKTERGLKCSLQEQFKNDKELMFFLFLNI
jgi:hypothetical protein